MTILITGGSGFIGTNLIEFLEQNGVKDIVNFDKNKPINSKQNKYWICGNIMNELDLDGVFFKYNIDTLIHLAARTDTLSDNLEDYKENHEGSKHLINSIVRNKKVRRLIVASTQYVYKSDETAFPTNNFDFKPHTIYGLSKVLTEQYVHASNLKCCWTIVRPTNIWGPWHMRYPVELWKIIDKSLYFHPVSHPVIRTYGYVKNIVHQVYQILLADEDLVNRKTFYLGDYSIDSYSWINEFSLNLNGKKIQRLPTLIFKILAKIGDFLRKYSIPFPLYSNRFKNMVEDYPAPTEPTIKLFGTAELSLKKNVLETIEWLKSDGKLVFNYWNKK